MKQYDHTIRAATSAGSAIGLLESGATAPRTTTICASPTCTAAGLCSVPL